MSDTNSNSSNQQTNKTEGNKETESTTQFPFVLDENFQELDLDLGVSTDLSSDILPNY